MRRKTSYVLFLILILLPLIHIGDNALLVSSSVSEPISEELLVTTQSNDFAVKIHVGDPFSKPYKSLSFNPNDDVLITGSVKNLAVSGSPTITLAIWLVSAKTPYNIQTHILNLSAVLPLKASRTFYELNGNSDVIWNIGNHSCGTYRFMAQIFMGGIPVSLPTVSGKPIVIRKLRLADFHINYSRTFRPIAEYSLPTISSSYGLDYYDGILYMTDYTNNAILKINAETGAIQETILIRGYAGNPFDIVYHSKHGFYIAYRHNNEIISCDFDGSFKYSIPFTRPMGLCMLGSYLGVTNDSSNIMYEIYPFSGDYLDSWAINTIFPYGLTVDWTNSLIWYADCQQGTIRGLDYNSHKEEFVLNAGTLRGLAFDGTYLWAWDQTNKKLIKLNPHVMHFSYNITNTGNCPIEGTWKIHIEQLQQARTVQWGFYDDVDSTTYLDQTKIYLAQRQSLLGSAFWDIPAGLVRSQQISGNPPSYIFRLYIGILDETGTPLYNLNDSMPCSHPTQGGMYIDSDKFPRLQMRREITPPTRYLVPEDLNVTLYLEVIGLPLDEIGIFNLSSDLIYGVKNIEIIEELKEAVIPPSDSDWYSIDDGPPIPIDDSQRTGNFLYFNSSRISQLDEMTIGDKLKLKYNIRANFTREIKRPAFPEEKSERDTISFREELFHARAYNYYILKEDKIKRDWLVGPKIDPSFFEKKIGVVLWLGPLLSQYDTMDVLELIIYLIVWVNHLPSWLEGTIYYIDDDMATEAALNYFGFSAAQKAQFMQLENVVERADFIYANVADRNLIAQYIEELVTNEAEEEDWFYMMLVGGDNIIPMRILDSPLQPFVGAYANAEVATDFFYGDFTPEANLDVQGYMPELVVSRLAGRTPQDMITFLLAGNSTSSGRAGLISYYKGEDSMRRLANIWDAVKEPNDVLYETEGQYTDAQVEAFLNPGSARYGNNPSNFPYAFILFSDHAGTDSLGDGLHVEITQLDLAGFADYTDGHRPFYFIRACRAGWIEDPGAFKFDFNAFPQPGTSFCLDLISKGVAGILASTRNSFSPNPSKEFGLLVDTDVRPDPIVPLSQSGTYKVGTINFEGNILDCFAVDPFNANEYTMGGIDFTGDDDFNDVVNGVPEIMDFGDFFESPNSPPGTFFWRYQLDYEFDPQSQSWAVLSAAT